MKYFTFKTKSKVPLSPSHPAVQKSSCFLSKPKQRLTVRQMLLKSDKHNVRAHLYHCVAVGLLEIIAI
jgi:hypothetical protein